MMVKLLRSNSAKLLSAASLFVALLLAGCTPQEPFGTISGKVTRDGSPVSDCRVLVYNTSSRRTIGCPVKEDGTFFYKKLVPGEYQAAVLQAPSYTAEQAPFDKRIPKKYRDRKTSGFEITVEEGDNQLDLAMDK